VLGRLVRQQVGAAPQAADRAGDHDAAAPALHGEPAEGRPDAQEDTAHVHRHHPIELGDGQLGQRGERTGDARVEMVQVDPAELLDGRCHVRRHVVLDGDVGAYPGPLGGQ
jgi:hypothetical protein